MTSTSLSAPSGSRLLRSGFLMPAALVLIVAILVVAPLVRILLSTLTPEGLEAWVAVLASPLSTNLWWRPLLNTMVLGFSVASGCLLIGGFLAWLVVLTDVPGRRFLDRILILPGGFTVYVECKRPKGGRYSPHQVETLKRLKTMGHWVETLHTKKDVDAWLHKHFT